MSWSAGWPVLAILLLASCGDPPPAVRNLQVILRSDQDLAFEIVALDGRLAGRSGEPMLLGDASAQVRDGFVFDAAARRRFTVDLTADDHSVFMHPDLGRLALRRRVSHPDEPERQIEVTVQGLLVTAQVVEARDQVIYTVRLAAPPLPPLPSTQRDALRRDTRQPTP